MTRLGQESIIADTAMLKGKKVLLVEDKQNAFASGMNGHISKPIDIPKLKATIAKFI